MFRLTYNSEISTGIYCAMFVFCYTLVDARICQIQVCYYQSPIFNLYSSLDSKKQDITSVFTFKLQINKVKEEILVVQLIGTCSTCLMSNVI